MSEKIYDRQSKYEDETEQTLDTMAEEIARLNAQVKELQAQVRDYPTLVADNQTLANNVDMLEGRLITIVSEHEQRLAHEGSLRALLGRLESLAVLREQRVTQNGELNPELALIWRTEARTLRLAMRVLDPLP